METGGLFMKSEFQTMTIKELKEYVLAHRNDNVAFQALMERVDQQPQKQLHGEVDSVKFFELVEEYRHSQSDQQT